MKITFVSDVEGRWEKLADSCERNPWVTLDGDTLVLHDDATFVYGGDTIDRGGSSRRLLRTLVNAKDQYGDRVVLLAGNRDVNKLRLPRELAGHPRAGAPGGTRAEVLRWTYEKTMGAADAFGWRLHELGADDDDAVVDSFLDDLAPDGALRRYLERAQLAWRADETLFVHGAVTGENLGVTPDGQAGLGLDAWVRALNDFYARGLDAFRADPRGTGHHELVQYQAPLPGTRANARSVIYARPVDPLGNPVLPNPSVRAQLAAAGIVRVVVGHTPAGDTPALVRTRDFELVVADNSYGRLERGSMVRIDGARTVTRGRVFAECTEHEVRCDVVIGDDSAVGTRGADGRLVKGTVEDGRTLLFRFLAGFVAEERLG